VALPWRLSLLFSAIGLAWLLAGSALAQQPFGQPQGQFGMARFRLVKVYDEHGFHQPVEAFRLLIPSDWQLQAWVRWRPEIVHCPTHAIDSGARATAPDGVTGIEFFPVGHWRWIDDAESRQIIMRGGGGCPWSPTMTAAENLRQALPRARPGAQIVGGAPDPQLASSIDQQLRAWLQPFIQAGHVHGLRVDSGRFRLRYLVNGRPVDEQISGTLKIVAAQSASYGQVTGQGRGPLTTYSVTAEPWIAARAAQGQLEAWTPVFATIVGSITPNLSWVRAVQLVSHDIANIRLGGAVDRARIWHQAQQEIGQIYTQAYWQQQRVQGGLAHQFSESIRGVETFVDRISGERVELTGGYRQAWSNGRGEYILSNDPNFNPGVTFREDWQEMPRVGR
jgi:hypothetical protein